MDTLKEIARHHPEYWKRKLDQHKKDYDDFFEAIRQFEEDTGQLYPRDEIKQFEDIWLPIWTEYWKTYEVYEAYRRGMKVIGNP